MNQHSILKILRVLAESAAGGSAEGITVALLCRTTGIRAQEVVSIVDHLAWAGLLAVHWPEVVRLARYRLTRAGEQALAVLEGSQEETAHDDHDEQRRGRPDGAGPGADVR